MSMLNVFSKELAQEAITTRKMLERIPDGQYDYKPHEKSMSMRQLATHVAEIPSWFGIALNTSEIDFANDPFPQPVINTTMELLTYLDKNLADAKVQLENAREAQLDENWTMRSGDHIISTRPKAEVIRMSFSQLIHHRAQLGVYLRLLNIPIPGSYGPSADEMGG